MKITGWTYIGDQRYQEIDDTWNIADSPYDCDVIRPLIINELRKQGYKFSGFYHQDGCYGTPIIDDKYTVLYSFRSWGGIMADAYNIPDEDGMAYCDWAWNAPEEEIIPKPDDYKGEFDDGI